MNDLLDLAMVLLALQAQMGATAAMAAAEPEHRPPLGLLQEEHFLSLRARWKDAVERWKRRLVTNNWSDDPNAIVIDKFKSYKDLLDDLKAKRKSLIPSGFVERVKPALATIQRLLPMLEETIAAPKGTPESTLVWAVLQKGLDAATIVSGDTRCEILRTIEELDSQLRRFDQLSSDFMKFYAKDAEIGREIAEALVDMFEAIINFWHETVIAIEDRRGSAWPSLNETTQDAIKAVTDAVEGVQKFWDPLAKVARQRSEQVNEEINADPGDVDRAIFPCDNIPSYEVFRGREEYIKRIQEHLNSAEMQEVLRSFSIYGLPGIGKSSVALRFAHLCKESKAYHAIFWIKGKTEMSCRQSFSEIARDLGLVRRKGAPDYDASVGEVMAWLRKTKHSWLLIYDDFEDEMILTRYLPPHDVPGAIMVTTRPRHVASKVGGRSRFLEVLPLNDTDSMALFDDFGKLYRRESAMSFDANPFDPAPCGDTHGGAAGSEDIKRLMDLLGGHPLGIEHIAAYITNKRLFISEFLHKYSKVAAAIHKDANTTSKAQHTIYTLWKVPLDQIRDSSPNALCLLHLVVMLSPTSIPLDLFRLEDAPDWSLEEHLAEFDKILDDPDTLEEAVNQLQAVALVGTSNDTISLHRLLHHSIYLDLTQNSRQKAFDVAAKLLNHAFPKQSAVEFIANDWPACRQYIVHAQSLAAVFTRESKKTKKRLLTSSDLQELMTNSAWYLYEIGEYQDAHELVQKALPMCPLADRQSSLHYAHLCNTAGVVYFEWNDLATSEKVHRESLQIRTRLLPRDHILVYGSRMNLGQVFSARGNLDEAEAEFDECDAIIRRSGAKRTPQSVGLTKMILGRTKFLKKEFGEARRLFDESRRILVGAFGGDSILLAYLMLCYGNLEMSECDIVKAQDAYQKGLRMTIDLTPKHGLVAAFHYKLGNIQKIHGNHVQCLAHCENGLAIANLRKVHGDRARVLYLKSECLRSMRWSSSSTSQPPLQPQSQSPTAASSSSSSSRDDVVASNKAEAAAALVVEEAAAEAAEASPAPEEEAAAAAAAASVTAANASEEQQQKHREDAAKGCDGEEGDDHADHAGLAEDPDEVRKEAEREKQEQLKIQGEDSLTQQQELQRGRNITDQEVYDSLVCAYNR